ncbi:hypothetical protein OG730_16175 [Streptomyces sp. NBC_01298]|uniref:hypothetical protein n=1 Tax=Streptomyces sp. NBC_01298 TaxID=2903817 RepID=UPI002E0EB066|nr:hypothetical protein OG730_16175 [Streptomyces sp. NBC_01298]
MSATHEAIAQLLPLAGDTFDKNKVTPGLLGFVVFAALALGVWGLMKSMSRHMGRVDFKEAPEPAAAPASAPAEGTRAP